MRRHVVDNKHYELICNAWKCIKSRPSQVGYLVFIEEIFMLKLNQQEIAAVSGGNYDGGGLGDAIGNLSQAIGSAGENLGNALTGGLFAPIGAAAYGVGEKITTTFVNLFNGIFGGKQY